MARNAVSEWIAPSPSSRMTYEEFLAWADEDTWAEWVDGEVHYMSPVTDEHADLAGWLLAILRPFVETHRLGIVRSEPVQMKTGPNLPGRSPDLLFVANENLGRRKKTHISGPADLVIEIVSPDSVERDRETKFSEYERGGVREYWVIDPLSKQAQFYELGEGHRYRVLPVDESGIFRSSVLSGLWLNVAWLWQDPLPPVLTVLSEWGLI
jgi:Uma2 family endonuclease